MANVEGIKPFTMTKPQFNRVFSNCLNPDLRDSLVGITFTLSDDNVEYFKGTFMKENTTEGLLDRICNHSGCVVINFKTLKVNNKINQIDRDAYIKYSSVSFDYDELSLEVKNQVIKILRTYGDTSNINYLMTNTRKVEGGKRRTRKPKRRRNKTAKK